MKTRTKTSRPTAIAALIAAFSLAVSATGLRSAEDESKSKSKSSSSETKKTTPKKSEAPKKSEPSKKSETAKTKGKSSGKAGETAGKAPSAELKRAAAIVDQLSTSQKASLTKLLNSGTKQDLMSLPGIGDTIADAIIKARPLESSAHLITVEGVGEKTLGEIVKARK